MRKKQLPKMIIAIDLSTLLLLCSLCAIFQLQQYILVVDGFAYAPNFITKIIEEQTFISPKGLLELVPLDGVESDDERQVLKNGALTTTLNRPVDDVDDDASIVKTRFPPEPNGYLHLGHAKAVSFNFAVARAFNGVCHMRLDDTNPSKEDIEYVNSILEDVKWIQDGLYTGSKPWVGPVRKTSDYFDLIYNCAVELIKSGDAYVDSLSADEMRDYRGTLTVPGRDSPYRTRSIDENLQLFNNMKDGVYPDGAHVLRAKIAMDSPNINMRDPTLYRIKHESHQETGDKWCIYPMYDFSHPISDSIEDITHSLCTLEFEDHRPFYDWTLSKLIPTGLLKTQSQQIEFSRLNIKSTILSKRKLIQLVNGGYVTGWDDPRMPTLSGMRRRGVPPSSLRLFCERIGISKADSNIDFSVLEACIRDTMDVTCPRAFCVLNPLKVTITNYGEVEEFLVDRHPKIPEMGQRVVPFSNTVYMERDDFFDTMGPEGERNGGKPPKGFKRLLPNGKVRLRYAYVIECIDIVRDAVSNEPMELKCTYYPETRSGQTPAGMERINGIIHWVDASTAVPCTVNQYDRLFLTEEPGKDSGDFLLDINPDSDQCITNAMIEPSVASDAKLILEQIKKNDDSNKVMYPSSLSYQFERNGYFALDKASMDGTNLVFNRVVTLRDTWGEKSAPTATMGKEQQPNQNGETASNRSRGGNSNINNESNSNNNEPIEDIRRISFRASTILSVEPHPEADNLLVCTVGCGDDEPRIVVAALAGKIPIEKLINQKVVVVTNLKPAKVRGVESTAMLLASSSPSSDNDEIVELLYLPDSVPNGEILNFDGKLRNEPDVMLKSKGAIKAWERAKVGLKTNTNGEVTYTDGTNEFRMISSAGPITTNLINSVIQ